MNSRTKKINRSAKRRKGKKRRKKGRKISEQFSNSVIKSTAYKWPCYRLNGELRRGSVCSNNTVHRHRSSYPVAFPIRRRRRHRYAYVDRLQPVLWRSHLQPRINLQRSFAATFVRAPLFLHRGNDTLRLPNQFVFRPVRVSTTKKEQFVRQRYSLTSFGTSFAKHEPIILMTIPFN